MRSILWAAVLLTVTGCSLFDDRVRELSDVAADGYPPTISAPDTVFANVSFVVSFRSFDRCLRDSAGESLQALSDAVEIRPWVWRDPDFTNCPDALRINQRAVKVVLSANGPTTIRIVGADTTLERSFVVQ